MLSELELVYASATRITSLNALRVRARKPRLIAMLARMPPELGHETSAKCTSLRESARGFDTHVEFACSNEVYYVP
jgi:hypothetical protein